jgi:hypothetical protein
VNVEAAVNAAGATGRSIKPRFGPAFMAIDPVVIGFAESYFPDRADAPDFGTTTDIVASNLYLSTMFTNVLDQPSHLLLVLNPSKEIERLNVIQCRQSIEAIQAESINQLIFHINLGTRDEAIHEAETYLIDHHALEHGDSRSRFEVRGQAKAYLNLFRRDQD